MTRKIRFMNLFKRLITLAVFSSAVVGWVGAEAIPPIDKTPVIVFINGKKYYIHTVMAGDTLYSIAKAYEVSEAAIKECNPSSADGLKIDQTIKIPVPEKVQAEARAEEEHFRTYRDREYGKPGFTPAAPAPAAPAQQPAAEDARTLQMPAVQPAAPAPQAAPQPKVTAPQPVQTAPQPAAAPAPKHKRTAPANSYKEAEAALNERIRADHILLSNPVIVRGLGLAPVIGAALDGQRALMLCIAALILVTFTRMLAVAICHLTGNRFRPVIYCYTAALLYIPTYVLLYALFGADLTLLGIYLPILVVEPAIVKRMEFSELEPVKEALRHGFNNALGMCVVLLLVGCLRELLATGAVFGHVVMHNALLPLAALPAGGFVILGVMAACWCAAANLYTDYKHEEVRRLYADRKH